MPWRFLPAPASQLRVALSRVCLPVASVVCALVLGGVGCGEPPAPVSPETSRDAVPTVQEPPAAAGQPASLPEGGDVHASVCAALDWLARQQNEDGSWGEGEDVGLTGLVVLSFLAAGEPPGSGPGENAQRVRRAIDFLRARDLEATPDLPAALACVALTESYALTGRKRLRPSAERAADHVHGLRPEGVLARFVAGLGRISARNAEVADSRGDAPDAPDVSVDLRATATTLALRVMAGAPRTEADDAAVDRVVAALPALGGSDADPWTQYATATVRRCDGYEPWVEWMRITFAPMIAGQVAEGPDGGSWPPHPDAGFTDARIATTALRAAVLANAYATNRFTKPWAR